mmetsp:Transcript_53656/g.113954  ORF Transcript_53656/g.113954 Transcript_53656/m.113954 type:complete len:283 (+) Transcript_53656:1536-2384(+)
MPLGRRITASHTALGLRMRSDTGSETSSGLRSKKSGLSDDAVLTSGNGLSPARSSLNSPSILTISAASLSQWFPSSAHRFSDASALTLRSCSSMLPGLTDSAELMNMSSWTLFLRSAAELTPFPASALVALSAASLYRFTSDSPSVASVMLWLSIFSIPRASSADDAPPTPSPTIASASRALCMLELNALSASHMLPALSRARAILHSILERNAGPLSRLPAAESVSVHCRARSQSALAPPYAPVIMSAAARLPYSAASVSSFPPWTTTTEEEAECTAMASV